MKTKVCLIAAILAVGGMGVGGAFAANTQNQAGQQQQQQQQQPSYSQQNESQAGFTQNNQMTGVQDTHTINSVREQVKEITEAALSKNDLSSLKTRLSEEDQQRLGSAFNQKDDQINKLAKEINKKWQDKYNQSFDSVDSKVALAQPFLTINSINRAQTAGMQTGASYGTEEARSASGANANENPENGAEKAQITLQATQKMPQVKLTMVREHMSWKLDVPDSVDAKELKMNLQNCLQKIDQMSSSWPSDQNKAYRMVTHQVMAALTNTKDNGAQPAAAH